MKKTITFADSYDDQPYHYERSDSGITIMKNDRKILLYGDDETQFIIDCYFAQKNGQNLSKIIDYYF